MIERFREISESVFLIPNGPFPLYLVKGEKNVLVDCAILALADAIERALQGLLPEGKLDSLLLTHSHYDHVGACSELQKRRPFDIVCSQRTAEILKNPEAIRFIDEMNQRFSRIRGCEEQRHFVMPERVTAVKEGDQVRLNGRRWFEVFATPGHTRCSLAFLLQPEKILFCGDAAGVIEKSGSIKPLFLSSYRAYEASLEKLIGLKAEIAALPHNNIVKGRKRVAEFLKSSLEQTREAKEMILSYLTTNRPVEAIAEEILEVQFPNPALMGPKEAMLINVVAMIHAVKREFAA